MDVLFWYLVLGLAITGVLVLIVTAQGDKPHLGGVVCCVLFWPAVLIGCFLAAASDR